MSIANSNLASQIIEYKKTEVGSIYFLDHIAVIEFNEGVHIELTSGRPVLHSIINYFGSSQPFGVIVNRINSYSVSLFDIKEFRNALPNLSAYGIIHHNIAGKMNAEIESQVCEWDNICFNNLYEGMDAVYEKIKTRINITLN